MWGRSFGGNLSGFVITSIIYPGKIKFNIFFSGNFHHERISVQFSFFFNVEREERGTREEKLQTNYTFNWKKN